MNANEPTKENKEHPTASVGLTNWNICVEWNNLDIPVEQRDHERVQLMRDVAAGLMAMHTLGLIKEYNVGGRPGDSDGVHVHMTLGVGAKTEGL